MNIDVSGNIMKFLDNHYHFYGNYSPFSSVRDVLQDGITHVSDLISIQIEDEQYTYLPQCKVHTL